MDEYFIDSDTDIFDLPTMSEDLPSDGPVYLLPVERLPEEDGFSSSTVPIDQPLEDWELVGVETYALSPITPSDASGLKKILLEILGPYDNIATQFKYQQQNNSYYTYVNEITPDYPWIASAVLFIVLVISLFRMFRSVLWKQ